MMIVRIASGQYSDFDVIKLVEMPLEDFTRFYQALDVLRKQQSEIYKTWALKAKIANLEPHRKAEVDAIKADCDLLEQEIHKLRKIILDYPEVESKQLWLG